MRNLFWFKPQERNGHRSSAQALSPAGPSESKHPEKPLVLVMCKQKEEGKAGDLVLLFIKVQGEVLNMEQKSITGISSRISLICGQGLIKFELRD